MSAWVSSRHRSDAVGAPHIAETTVRPDACGKGFLCFRATSRIVVSALRCRHQQHHQHQHHPGITLIRIIILILLHIFMLMLVLVLVEILHSQRSPAYCKHESTNIKHKPSQGIVCRQSSCFTFMLTIAACDGFSGVGPTISRIMVLKRLLVLLLLIVMVMVMVVMMIMMMNVAGCCWLLWLFLPNPKP